MIFGAWRRRIVFDDRTLTHLRVALRTRMERGASFRLTWSTAGDGGYRSQAILVHPGSVLEYRFDGHHADLLNRAWLRELLGPTLSRDMVLTAEPV
ncbi:hypothetical protein ASG06_08840 [Rathayibacter sp. Leaf185]|nr:hypothetical protein ASF42_08840 [Rathayibacter sp. Leaf294]KQS12048.1 hypothetical protein ASG06_08840 [Rathayibacter sp. Leaf185]